MDRQLADDDAVLFAAARVARDFAQLPGAPSPDWCERAATALAQAAPDTRAWVAVVRAGVARPPALERSGYADSRGGVCAEPEPSRTLRTLLGSLAWLLESPVRPCIDGLAELAARAPNTVNASALARAGEMVAGVSPVGQPSRDGRAIAILVLWGPSAPSPARSLSLHDLRRILRSAMPVLSDRLRLVMRGGGERAPWLSGREQRVLDLLTRGHSVPEIADFLGRSQHTVHDYVKTLHRKLGTTSRGCLVARALGYAGDQLSTRPAGGAAACGGPMLAFRTDGRTAFVDHGLF